MTKKNKQYNNSQETFFSPISQAQAEYQQRIESSTIVFGLGPAGTGKTYVPVAIAADRLYKKEISKIVVTRPAVEAGEKLGYLPGELEDKYEPYLAPVKEVFISKFGSGWYESQLKNGNIEAIPLGYMQGRTFDNSFIIADEMQNSTPLQMFMLLSRIGKWSSMVLNGSLGLQQVIRGISGLEDALRRLEGVTGVSSYTFESEDIVRSGMAKAIVEAYER